MENRSVKGVALIHETAVKMYEEQEHPEQEVGQVGMAIGEANGKIVMHFGDRPVQFIALTPVQARNMTSAMFQVAAKLLREETEAMERGIKS
jgi:hypothetical protein